MIMRIEEEINQTKPFKSNHHRALVNLIFTSNWMSSYIKSKLKPFEITLQQYNVLRILRGAGEPISTSCIRSRMVERMADTSRLVERLCTKGWVNKEACCSDNRLVDITISDQGTELVEHIESRVSIVEAITQNLNDEEARLLGELLDKLRGTES